MANEEIGAKIVVTGETSGAQAAVKAVTQETQAFATSANTARDATGRFAAGQQAAQGAVTATGSGIAGLKGHLVQLAGALPGVGGTLTGAIEGAGGAFGHLSAVAGAAASGPLALVTAGVGAVTAGLGVAEQAIDSFANKQDRVTGLDAALAQQGELTDEYRAKLQRLSGQLGAATGQGSAWLGVLQKLTQRGADESNISQYADAVKNLAGLLGGDLDRAVMVWGRAMNGNFEVLRRYGVEVDKSKDRHAQLAEAMQLLATRGGGQLEAQTHTLHGQFRALTGAVGGLFSGLGNLISQTGIVQEGLKLLTGVVRAVGSVFPKTVEQVDGLTNRLPFLKDAAGQTKGALGELGGELDETGQSAEGAAGGIGKTAEAAGKAKDEYEAATEAAEKLREEQDRFADAKTQLALAKIDAAQEGGQVSKADADRQRVNVRAAAESDKLDREFEQEHETLRQQRLREGRAKIDANAAQQVVGNAEEQFSGAARSAGLSPEEAARIAQEAEDKNTDLFGDKAKGLRRDAQRSRDAAREQDSGENADPVAAERSRKEAEAYDHQAESMQKLKAAYDDLRQKRANASELAGKEADETKKTEEAVKSYSSKVEEIGVRRQTADLHAGTEQKKLDNEAKQKREDDERKQRDEEIKSINSALRERPPGQTDADRQIVIERRRALEKANDDIEDRNDAAQNRNSPEYRRRRKQGLDQDRAVRDETDSGGGDAVVGDALALLGTLPTGTPGSLPGQARSLIEQIIRSGGKNSRQDDQLLGVLQAIAENLAQQGGENAKRDAIVKKLQTDMQTAKTARSSVNGL